MIVSLVCLNLFKMLCFVAFFVGFGLVGVFLQNKLIQFFVPVHGNLDKPSLLFCGQGSPQLNKISNYF